MSGFKVDVKFDSKGFEAEVKRGEKEAFENGVKQEVAQLRCPVHHRTPTVRFRGMEAEITGCCEHHDALIQKELR